jgi:ubiquinone/menaquinone biosynthesis C-methylase UbiE
MKIETSLRFSVSCWDASMERSLKSENTSNRFESRLKYAHFYRIREYLENISFESKVNPITVMDVACGPGNMALFCKDIPDIEWFGLELWPSELQQAYRTCAYSGLIQANLANQLPLRHGVTDVVILNEILMYLDNSSNLLNEFYKILRPSGVLCVYNPIYYTPTVLSTLKRISRRIYSSNEAIAFDRESDWKSASRASRITFYSFDSLISEVRHAGFEIVHVAGFRMFRNRIRVMRKLESHDWYRTFTKQLAGNHPRWASDILVIAKKQHSSKLLSRP